MPQEIPNLAGVATKDLVETIGSGKFSASYINWSRTLNLLHKHAPGWCVEAIPSADGGLVHRAPGVGGYLLIQFRHVDGTVTPPVPQAVMDNRNASIPFEKIGARDVTDTHRRGACLAAAMTFGLAQELWAKQELESGYSADPGPSEPLSAPVQAKKASATKEQFLEAAVTKGLTTHAAEELLSKLNGNFAGGIQRLEEKDAEWVQSFNEACAPKNSAEKW